MLNYLFLNTPNFLSKKTQKKQSRSAKQLEEKKNKPAKNE